MRSTACFSASGSDAEGLMRPLAAAAEEVGTTTGKAATSAGMEMYTGSDSFRQAVSTRSISSAAFSGVRKACVWGEGCERRECNLCPCCIGGNVSSHHHRLLLYPRDAPTRVTPTLRSVRAAPAPHPWAPWTTSCCPADDPDPAADPLPLPSLPPSLPLPPAGRSWKFPPPPPPAGCCR